MINIDCYENFIRERITSLRLKKGISEYKMSLDLGHSKTYIQNISSGRVLPSLSEFLAICDYIGVSPREFFDEKSSNPILVDALAELAKTLPDSDIMILLNIAEKFSMAKDASEK